VSATEALRRSQERFVEIVWPKIRGMEIWDGEPELLPVENVGGKVAETLDYQGGADYALTYDDGGLEFVASRVCGVNRDGRVYNEFTVRDRIASGWPTEMDKRCRAAINGRLLLSWVVQANVVDGRLSWACVARAREFYPFICPLRDRLPRRQTDDAAFLKISPLLLEGVQYEEWMPL
jgi:hypothetical protein